MLSYMNNPSTMVQHLQVQQDVYTRMSNSGYMDEFRDEINLYFLHSFYAETFYFMAARRMPMPAVMLRYMINVVKNIFRIIRIIHISDIRGKGRNGKS